jgi:hypothetical protein
VKCERETLQPKRESVHLVSDANHASGENDAAKTMWRGVGKIAVILASENIRVERIV